MVPYFPDFYLSYRKPQSKVLCREFLTKECRARNVFHCLMWINEMNVTFENLEGQKFGNSLDFADQSHS